MKELTTHIGSKDYEATISALEANQVDFLDPIATNKLLKKNDFTKKESTKNNRTSNRNFIYYLAVFNSLIPWIIWKKAKKNIKEKEFISTFRYGLCITLFPFFYILQSFIINYFLDAKIAVAYFISSILLGLLLTKFSKVSLK